MPRWLLVLATLTAFALPAWGDEPGELKPNRTGRPGELTPEEEDKLDKIIDYFILYDIGRHRDPKAVVELDKLGPEAIPALIRGVNKAAKMSHSCPVVTLAKKLKTLLSSCQDEKVLAFARDNIGAGVGRTRYDGILKDLKLMTVFRTAQLQRMKPPSFRRDTPSSGDRSPGSKDPE